MMLDRLRALRDSCATGVLRLTKEGSHMDFAYRDGLIDGVSGDICALPPDPLSQEAGASDGTSVTRLLLKARREKLAGADAPPHRDRLDEAHREESVRRRIVQAVALALKEGFAEESFGGTPTRSRAPGRVDLMQALLEIARLDGEALRIPPGARIALRKGQEVSHLPWHPDELAVLGELKRADRLQDLAIATGIDVSRVGRILHVLAALGLIETSRNG